ncbi:phage holin family protein [Gracilimonas amylolytica]|uniref:phage holin family protein n=1 Tax=Gracilimonas amylolytica TaxID=1749045 RepID=UPI000CD8B7BA|nr:phage holin family protein [Gracilimonas amylolytica]
MDDLGKRIKHVTHELKEYVEKRMELTILNISGEITYWVGRSVQSLVGYTILALGLVFALIAMSIFIGDLVGEEWAGFAIVSAPIILAGLVLVIAKPKSIVKKIQDQMLDELLTSIEKKELEEKAMLTEKTSNKESENNV